MTRMRPVGFVDAAVLRVLAITTVILCLFRTAHADNVSELIKQLEADSDKVRLAAVLNLTKLGDERAILPIIKVLGNDSSDEIREAAAVALGKIVTSGTKSSMKNLAIKSLKNAESGDSSSRVKSQASKTLAALGAGGGGTAPPTGSGSGKNIYVNIGPMSSKTGDSAVDAKMRPAMVKVAQQTLSRSAPSMAQSWSGGTPSATQLTQKGFQGFYVDGTLNELKVSNGTVSCKISMLLASFPDKSVFGLLSGGAKVQGGTSARDLALSQDDCVAAVVEDLIAKKIVPTIKTKVGVP
ncbi:MAG: HEAT repeat domain-containing protein [Myxococcales bacterium]|nr:HEAT repeat domain-containing protein [Myxococcales bacterium]